MAEPTLGFFVAGSAAPDEHLKNTVQLMIDADAWIAVTMRQHPIHGLEVDVKSANLTPEQLKQILQYSVTATSGPPTAQN